MCGSGCNMRYMYIVAYSVAVKKEVKVKTTYIYSASILYCFKNFDITYNSL